MRRGRTRSGEFDPRAVRRRLGARAATVALALSCAALACAQSRPANKEQIRVAVTILPQAYLVERVGGEHVAVEVLVGPGQSPHAYDATPRQLEGLSHAKAYFTIGVDAENGLVPRLRDMFRELRIVDMRAGIPLRRMLAEEANDHDASEADHKHADDHDHEAGRPDPHCWLNPLYAKTLGANACRALVQIDLPHADDYRKNLAALERDLDRLNERLTEALAPLKGREIFVFHPAFGYFTDAYGLKQRPIEIEGKEPTAKQLAQLVEQARAAKVRVIFVQPQFSPRSAEAVAQGINGVVVPMDDLPRDYIKALEDMAEKVKAALQPG